MGKRVFSYCVYGGDIKYCLGMLKNIKQISQLYPDYEVWIHCGNDVPSDYIAQYRAYPNVQVLCYPFTGGRLMCYRFFCMDDHPEIDVLISRDADSRFEERDIWAIEDFLKSEYKVFTIRDHPWHGRGIMAGLCGFKRIPGLALRPLYDSYSLTLSEEEKDKYQVDQTFLEIYVYFKYKLEPNTLIVYTTRQFYDETVRTIECPRKTPYDFCGNVVLFREDGSEVYEFRLDRM